MMYTVSKGETIQINVEDVIDALYGSSAEKKTNATEEETIACLKDGHLHCQIKHCASLPVYINVTNGNIFSSNFFQYNINAKEKWVSKRFIECCQLPESPILVKHREVEDQQKQIVEKLFNMPSDRLIFAKCLCAELSIMKAQCLKEGQWFNDAVIHLFMSMLQEKDNFLCTKKRSRKGSLFVDPMFMDIYLKDNNYDYNQVKRYTIKRKVI